MTTTHPLFQAAIDADNAFQAELVSVYGARDRGALRLRKIHSDTAA